MNGNYTGWAMPPQGQTWAKSTADRYVTKAPLDRRLEEQRKQIREELIKELTEDFMAQLQQVVELKD